jgi:hypothetical protein
MCPHFFWFQIVYTQAYFASDIISTKDSPKYVSNIKYTFTQINVKEFFSEQKRTHNQWQATLLYFAILIRIFQKTVIFFFSGGTVV